MARWDRFTFRVSHEERQAIAELAFRMKRSQSAAVRFVILTTARIMKTKNLQQKESKNDVSV
jgi:hypothetical protein